MQFLVFFSKNKVKRLISELLELKVIFLLFEIFAGTSGCIILFFVPSLRVRKR